jgi:hypothetical protein
MGADLILVCAERTATYDQAKARLSTLDNKKVGSVFCYGDEPEEDDKTDYLAELLTDLDVVYSDDRRDTSVMRLGDVTYVMTGGMSWGDIPTDAFDPINRIAELCITCSDDEWENNKGYWEKGTE